MGHVCRVESHIEVIAGSDLILSTHSVPEPKAILVHSISFSESIERTEHKWAM